MPTSKKIRAFTLSYMREKRSEAKGDPLFRDDCSEGLRDAKGYSVLRLRRAFSLVELLIVVAIICVLMLSAKPLLI
jgi:prepilin-type N-terminal cleavage/methylation domain-containing protein